MPLLLPLVVACATAGPAPRLDFEPDALRQAVAARVPDLEPADVIVPFEVEPEHVILAGRAVAGGVTPLDRIQRLVDVLSAPPPDGFGLRYEGSATGTAHETTRTRRGNCLALGTLLVGLARELGWGALFAEAMEVSPLAADLHTDDLGVLADHTVVVLSHGGERAVVDFAGRFRAEHAVRIIDDVAAVAHFHNNWGYGHIVLAQSSARPIPWSDALSEFERATAIKPGFARAWNNRGVALARLGRYPEARDAYRRALEIDDQLQSALRNLEALERREHSLGASPTSQDG